MKTSAPTASRVALSLGIVALALLGGPVPQVAAGSAHGTDLSAPRACRFALRAQNDLNVNVRVYLTQSSYNDSNIFRNTRTFDDVNDHLLEPGESLDARVEVPGRCSLDRDWRVYASLGSSRDGEMIEIRRWTDSEKERTVDLGDTSCWALAPVKPAVEYEEARIVEYENRATGCDPTSTRYGPAPEEPKSEGGAGGADPTDEPAFSLGSLQGHWRRFDSNNPRNDGMRAVVQGSQATLTFIPEGGSDHFSEGNLLWRDIQPSGSLQVRGSNGAYYDARLVVDGDDRIHIDIESTGAGNDQTWDRAGPSIDGEWMLAASSDGRNEGVRIRVAGDEATIRYLPASASTGYRVGDQLWRAIGQESLEALSDGRSYVSSGYRLASGERLRVEVDGVVQLWVRPGAGGGIDVDDLVLDPTGGGEEVGEDAGEAAACVSTGLVGDVGSVAWGWGLTDSDPDPGSILSALPAWEAVPQQSRRVIDVDGSRVEGLDDHFALIWEANTGALEWAMERGLPPGEFIDAMERYEERGLRLADLEIDEVDGSVMASGIWTENVEGIEWDYDTVLTPSDVNGVIERQQALGYRLVDIEAFERNGERMLAAIWHRSCAGADWDWVADVDRDTYQERLDAAVAQGHRMIDVESWSTPGGQRYAAIFETPGTHREFRARSGRDLKSFLNYHRRYLDEGFRLTDYESYEEDGDLRYAGIWVENDSRYGDPVRPVLDTLIENYRVAADVPGMSVVVIEDGEVVYRRGFGRADPATDKWAWSGTVYLTASVSKVVGAALAARLEEKLADFDLARPTAEYLVPALDYVRDDLPSDAGCTTTPDIWFCQPLPEEHTHTVEQLLAKTACVPHYTDTLQNGNSIDYTPDQRYYRWRAEALHEVWDNGLLWSCTPGQDYHYSTPGFTFVGAVLESQTGKDIATLIQDEISDPLGLSTLRAMYTPTGLRQEYDRAEPYWLTTRTVLQVQGPDTLRLRADPVTNPSIPAAYEDSSWKVLGGGIESDAMDLARFGFATMDGQVVRRPSRLWSPQTHGVKMWPNGGDAPLVGLAWEMDGQYAWHSGSWVGARSGLLLAVNDGISIAILSNRRNQKIVRLVGSGHSVRGIKSLAEDILGVVQSR